MKLFVWEGVLEDYSPGMIVALAPDISAAMAAVKRLPGIGLAKVEQDMTSVTPTVVDLPGCTRKRSRAWVVWGGG